ncbi:MAG: CDP-diacylglycerol--serine O-phosphatidyltransferase [Sphingomonadales bacterium]|nr:CDP-diacylglycerol--serine O-phosphatidyltransferase [Sphingomonadales bacterium]
MIANRISIRGIIPNVVTILALIAGMTAIRFAIEGRFEHAVLAVVLAGVLDGLDGSIARLLKSTSTFGAELDSLSDVISFGVAPAMILYIWWLNNLDGNGWLLSLAFVVSQALRLARFNSQLEVDEEPRKKAGYLTGFPAPVAAALALLPMMVYFEWGVDFRIDKALLAIYIALICFGMVSKIPTFSFKQLVISKNQMVPLLLFVALFATSITVYGWLSIIAIGFLYIMSIPYIMWRYRRMMGKISDKS